MQYSPSDIIEYIIILVTEIAKRFSITTRQAYHYMRKYDAVKLIEDNYGIMHTLSFKDAVDSIVCFCSRKGGELS